MHSADDLPDEYVAYVRGTAEERAGAFNICLTFQPASDGGEGHVGEPQQLSATFRGSQPS